jgi:WD40 repeat protein
MSRIFLSHSSNDNDSAVALRDWLAAQGWNDVFLDLDPVLGLAPGERWQNALKLAADRCEAVLFLISPNWLSSRWCLSEFLLAKQLGKRLFPIIVGDVSIASLPLEMSSDHQVVDIVHDPQGWEKLKHGLKRAGLDADSFTFPAGRRIYPGFEPLTEDDAAIFFGRDAQILRGLDRLRLMRDAGAERMMVIVGASGAGKSSFLRAGLWPRLRRDDRNFWPLPVIRPERAALSGRSGLHAAFEGALADPRISAHPALASFPRSRAALGDTLSSEGPERLLAAIRLAAAPLSEGMSSPTLVLCIDQAEELFDQEGGGEGDSFLRLLAATLETTSHLLVILSIRSDAYPSLQIEPRLAKIAREPFDLPPMPESSLRAVIEGPARFAVPPLKLEPAFVDALLADAKGQDALPLMAFTLNRLTREYGADHTLSLKNYESSGGLRGAIGAAVNEALDRARGSVSRDERELETLLRQAFVPHLARVNEAGEFARRIALATEIPQPSRALVDVLIEARLLIRDRSARGEMIEVAHEALLREWPLLRRFLDADRDFLVGKRQLADDLAIWRDAPSERKADALLTGLRLTRAQQWLIEREPHELSDDERAFIRESVHAAQARQRRRARLAMAVILLLAAFSVLAGWQWTKARHEADIAEQEKRHATDETERAKAASDAASRNADLAKTNERLAITAARKAQRGESLTLAQESLDESAHGDIGGAIRTALGALPADLQRPDRPFEPRAEFALAKAIFADRLIYSLTPVQDKVNAAAYSPDGRLIATGTRDGVVTLWDSSSGQLIRSFSESKRAVFGVAFSPDGQLIAASYEDPVSIVVREVATGNRLWDQPAIGWIPHLLFTPDSKRLITAASSWDQRPRVWDARTGGQIFTLDRNTSQSATTHWVALSPSGRYFASGTSFVGDQEVVVWDMTTGRVVLSNAPNIATDAHPGSFNFEPGETPLWGGFAGDSEDLILRSTGLIYEVNPDNGTIVRRTRFSYEDKIFSSETGLSADGSRMAIATSSTELSVLDAKSGSRLATLRGHISPIQNVALSNDGKLVAATAADHSIRVWDVATTKEIAHLEGHQEFTIVSKFSADKRRLLSFGDRSARVWDVGPDWRRWSAGLPDGWRFVTIDPNGTHAIVEHQKADGDPTPDNVDEIGLWDVTASRTLRRIKNTSRLKAHVDKNAFSPDGRFVALRFDFYDKESTQEEDDERENLTELVTRGLLEPDSLPADGRGFFEIIDVQSGETKHVLASDGHPYNSSSGVRWAPNGEMIVLGTPQWSEDDEKSASSIEIWKTVARRLLARIDQRGTYDGEAHFSADMKKVSVQMGLSYHHTQLSVLDLPEATNRLSIELATSKSARFAAGDRILTGGEDAPPALLDAASGKPIGNIAKEQVKVTNAFISDDETRLLVQRDSSPVSLWDLTTRKLLAYLPDEKTTAMNASFSGDGTKILVRSFKANVGNTFDIFDARDGTHARSFGPFPFMDGYGLNSYFLSRTGKYLAVSTSAPHVTIWHVEDGTSSPEIVLNGRLQRWRFTYGDQRLVTADSSGQLQVFDTASGRLVSKIDGVDREAALGDATLGEKDISIIFSPGNGVGVLDTSTGAVTSRISQAGKIRSAWLSPDSSVLLAVTPDQAGFYALPKGEQIASIPHQGDELNAVSSIQDGQRIFLHTRKGVVALLDVPGRKIVGIYHSDLAGQDHRPLSFLKAKPKSRALASWRMRLHCRFPMEALRFVTP